MNAILRPFFAALLGYGLLATASAQEFRVGFVNTDRIFREANTAKQAQTKLEQEFAQIGRAHV